MITILAGGTGSIKLIRGLAVLEDDITVISNVGDNIWLFGLYICPDIDTVIYGLAKILDRQRGWGIKGDSFHCLTHMRRIGVPTWFGIGDRDLAMHVLRTSMIKQGKSLHEITDYFRKQYSIDVKIIPATDEEVSTMVVTAHRGEMHLQEFWVKHKGRPRVRAITFNNANRAVANPRAIHSIKRSDAVIVAPANPVSSIGPIIALSDLREELSKNRERVMAISPVIGKRAVSGPAVKYMKALGLENSSVGVARYYQHFVSRIIISEKDHGLKHQIERFHMQVNETDTGMETIGDEVRLGRYILKLVKKN
ncbi:MAG: 2-phospho-L-lactate transferase [Thermoproteota archaeon]|nr:2-phospho-L-lactate transferase [Thermoproteota archaeon]